MDPEWKDWDVVETIEGPLVPRFMVDDWETVEEYNRQTSALVAEHWNRFRTILTDKDNASDARTPEAKGSGYTALHRLQERMDTLHGEFQEYMRKWEYEVNLRELVIDGFREKIRELALERATDSEDTEPSEQELRDAWEHVLNRPMGEAWEIDRLSFPIRTADGSWEINYSGMVEVTSESDPLTQDDLEDRDLTVQYLPDDEALERVGIDPDSTSRFEIQSFDGGTTWGEALERLRTQFEARETQRERYDRSLKAIEFRRCILKNVLFQFEAYGSVEEMTAQRAEGFVQEKLPDIFEEGSKPLEYATEIVQKYQRAPSSLPEGSNKMGKFRESWVPDSENAEGNSKVEMIQREIRNANLSDEYRDPESFCDLLERLLERHREG